MARVLLVALVWCAARGEEYAGGSMLQYAAADYAPDYHLPGEGEGAAALDYRAEDLRHAPIEHTQKPSNELDDAEWRKPSRNQENPMRRNFDDPESLDLPLSLQKYKSNRASRRSRNKNKKSRGTRHRAAGGRGAGAGAVGEEPAYPDAVEGYDKSHYRESKREYRPEAERYRLTTQRTKKRKARDRQFAPAAERETDLDEDIVSKDRRMKEEPLGMEKEYGSGLKLHNVDEEYEYGLRRSTATPAAATRRATLAEYSDYYDMKRVYNIKNRLPILLRRTTVVTGLFRKLDPGGETAARPTRRWTARRGLGGLDYDDPMLRPRPDDEFFATAEDTATTTTSTSTTTTTTTTTTTNTTTTTPAPSSELDNPIIKVAFLPNNDTSEPSIAEKSRLSIWKKAQKKDSDTAASTKKPPVLLQVTNRMQTVVIVEPKNDVVMRAKPIYYETPERLERVKRLMRRKLISDAKNIHELTDRWDDMVCDYIDTSLVDSAAPRPAPAPAPLAALAALAALVGLL